MSNGNGEPHAFDTRSRRGRALRLVLIGSLALNLFLAGILGVWAARPLFHDRPGAAAGGMMERMARRLPERDQPVMRQAFEKRQQEIERRFDELRRAQQEVRRSLRADPFESESFDRAFARAGAARGEVHATFHQIFREAAPHMSPMGRARLAEPRRRRAEHP